MVGAIIITRKQIEVNTGAFNNRYNKSYPGTLKASNKALSVFAIASIGDLSHKNLSSHSDNLPHPVMLDSFMNKIKINISAVNNTNSINTVNSVDNKSYINAVESNVDPYLVNKVNSNTIDLIKSNIDYDLINKINAKININFNSMDKINITYKKAIECVNLEYKLPFISNISTDYLHNNIYIPIIDILTNYPHFIILPLLPLIF